MMIFKKAKSLVPVVWQIAVREPDYSPLRRGGGIDFRGQDILIHDLTDRDDKSEGVGVVVLVVWGEKCPFRRKPFPFLGMQILHFSG